MVTRTSTGAHRYVAGDAVLHPRVDVGITDTGAADANARRAARTRRALDYITYFTSEPPTPKHHSKCDKLQLDISTTTFLFDFIICR
ncbi:hypothetical protein ACN42_g11751 [Penicillium freii]|uniref:Uncharacterized protein n=1 Tax=Penicillium freii TaxID=48697 RepID=A0A101M7M7_PENFR|nr:hypothetical protein ACN42_g11751 [Penicillium freii]